MQKASKNDATVKDIRVNAQNFFRSASTDKEWLTIKNEELEDIIIHLRGDTLTLWLKDGKHIHFKIMRSCL